jgi:hypothetical protein
MGGRITSFNICHVKRFTSKIKKNMTGLRSPGNYFWFFFILFTWDFEKTSIIHYSRGMRTRAEGQRPKPPPVDCQRVRSGTSEVNASLNLTPNLGPNSAPGI